MNCSAGPGPASPVVLQRPPAEVEPPERPGAGGEPVAPTTSNTWNGRLRSGRGVAECACARRRRRRDPGRVPGCQARSLQRCGALIAVALCAPIRDAWTAVTPPPPIPFSPASFLRDRRTWGRRAGPLHLPG